MNDIISVTCAGCNVTTTLPAPDGWWLFRPLDNRKIYVCPKCMRNPPESVAQLVKRS